MRLTVCESDEQVRMAQALRYEVYCREKGWIAPESCPDGLEIDEYDDLAVHFLVTSEEDGTPLGTSRLLIGSRQSLPAEHFIDLAALDLDRTRVVEVSRMAVRRASRSQDLSAWLAVTKVMWEWSMRHDMLAWASVTDAPLFALMRRVGMPIIASAPKTPYLGSVCVPSVVDMARTGDVLRKRGFLEEEVA